MNQLFCEIVLQISNDEFQNYSFLSLILKYVQ